MKTNELTRIELSSQCICITFDDDDNEIESDQCFGCYQDELEYLTGEIGLWLNANGYDDETIIRVQANGITWQRLDGYSDITVADIPEFLNISGDFRIVYEFTADYKTLTARRYSHDEPVGTGLITFTRSPFSRCNFCGDVSECSQVDDDFICKFCSEKEWN
jgi:hypothetical protein